MAGALVAVALGVYGSVHDPTGQATLTLFFSSMVASKVWLATVALAAALFQLASALRLYGRVTWPAREPTWLSDAHRLSGSIALIASLPVAHHCLWSLGFNGNGTGDFRVLAHSLLGCFLYGAFVTKVVLVRSSDSPGGAIPVAGGALFSAIVLVWLTSSAWWLAANPTSSWF